MAQCGILNPQSIKSATFSVNVDGIQACDHNRKPTIMADLGCMLHDTYNSCALAEYEAFMSRHLLEFTAVSPQFREFNLDHAWVPLTPMGDQELLASRPARMVKRYTRGLERKLTKNDATVQMFIKFEQMKLWAGRKPPRAIQARNCTYTANLAKYCVPMEHQTATVPMDDNHGFPMTTKGRNTFELADLIFAAYSRSIGPIYLVDHVAYDAHQGPHHQFIERMAFQKSFPGDSRVIELMKMQRHNKVYSKNGIRVRCKARRMSGDANTSVGNSIINYTMLRYVFGPSAIIMVNGDDSIIFSPNPPLHDFVDVGMETKWSVVHFMEDIEYCQMKPVLGECGWAMVKNPERVTSRKQLKLSNIDSDLWMRVVGLGEMISSPYDPISQAICRGYLKRSKSTKWNSRILSYQAKEMGRGIKQVFPYNEQCATSYAYAWGLTMEEVKILSRNLETWAASGVEHGKTKTTPKTSFH